VLPADVRVRPYPYPYRAMLAVCSDLDETPNWEAYWEIMRFLNTVEMTAMGPGVGLEVANSVYFHEASGQFSYWGTDHAGRDMVRVLIRSGHIDCLHSYGLLARTRAEAARALDELDRHGCRLRVWVDHASGPTNFGPDIMRGHGDEVGHPAYHADLTIPFGIRYVWLGRVTSVVGQDRPWCLGGIARGCHPVASARTLGKEVGKHLFGRCGSPKYAMHASNRLLRPKRLRDGRAVLEFMRSNPHWAGVNACTTAGGIGEVLTDEMLSRLVQCQGVCILYTHLGKVSDPAMPLGPSAQQAFRTLAARQHQGEILVTTTQRLLQYRSARDALQIDAHCCGGALTITIGRVADPVCGTYDLTPDRLSGLTFVTRLSRHAEVRTSSGLRLPCSVRTLGDETIISLPWEPLVFPEL